MQSLIFDILRSDWYIYFICGVLSVIDLGSVLEPPQLNVTWESNATSITLTLHTPPHQFDQWRLRIYGYLYGGFDSYLNSSQSTYTIDGLTYGVTFDIQVALYIGVDGFTDCGPMGTADSYSYIYASTGCNSKSNF